MSDHSDNNLIGDVAHGAKNLKNMVVNIQKKLVEEQKVTKKLNEGIKTNKNKMEFVLGKLSKLLKTRDNSQLFTIMLLFGVMLIQIFILIF